MRLLSPPAVIAYLAVALLLASFDPAAAQSGGACPLSIADLPGVVLDRARARLYADGPDRHLSALAAADGTTVWRSDAAQGPLALLAGKLLVWERDSRTRSLVFSLLDLSGTPPRPAPALTVALPDWARAGDAEASVSPIMQDCRLWLRWSVEQTYRGGAAPVPGRPETESRKAEGWVAIDSGGEFRVAEQGPPRGAAAARSAPYRQGFEWRADSFTVGGHEVKLERKQNPAGDQLSLVYDGTRAIDLGVGRDLMAMASMDHRYLFVSDLAQQAAGPRTTWTVVEVATGDVVAKIPLPIDVAAAALAGERLYYLRREQMNERQRTVLVAADGRDGRTLWQQTLADQQLPPPPP